MSFGRNASFLQEFSQTASAAEGGSRVSPLGEKFSNTQSVRHGWRADHCVDSTAAINSK